MRLPLHVSIRFMQEKWSAEMRELLGLEETVYPVIRGSAMQAGSLAPQIAEAFGLNQDAGDCGDRGQPGNRNFYRLSWTWASGDFLGTSGVFMMPVEEAQSQAKGKMILFSFDNRSYSYLVQGVVQCNGNTSDWWNRDIMDMKEFEKLTNDLDVKELSENELLFYPHLDGDKTLYADPDIRGRLWGSASTRAAQICFMQ